ncbi:MAG: TetR/AcrR family transcriptional regulator [Chloroflexota bacterium]
MGPTTTKERILITGMSLFADEGFAEISLRAITTAAGVNLAAVNYHFGSKTDLIRTIIRRVLGPINVQQLQLLDDLEKTTPSPSIAELLTAFSTPVLELMEPRHTFAQMQARLFSRVMINPGKEILEMTLEEVSAVDQRYLPAFGRVLPHLGTDELQWRYRSTIVVLVSHWADLSTGLYTSKLPVVNDHNYRAWMMTFLEAALRAPATEMMNTQHTTARTS